MLAAGAASAAANVLVVRSSGPSAKSFPAGRSLPDDARIALRAGDTLVVLDARGTRTFRGPGTFSPSVAPPRTTRTVAAPDGRRARIASVRSAGIVPASPTTIWQVDVAQSGTMCLANSREVMLWRADSALPATLAIAGPDGAAGEVHWPAGASTAAWPADLPIADGGEYRLSVAGSPVPSRVRFRALDSEPADVPAVAEALIRHGCQEQLDLLVDSAPSF